MKKFFAFLLFVLILAGGCTRKEPMSLTDLRIETQLPAHFKPQVSYAHKEIILTSSSMTYKFVTDQNGFLVIPELIPDVYTINTSWELSGSEYKALITEEVLIEDKAKVLLSATLQNIPLFTTDHLTLLLERFILKDLLISKIYYSGTKDNMDRNYTADAFVEIFNNSDEVVYIDGKYLALTESKSPPAFLPADDPNYIYTRQIVRFPGQGTDYPVLPGKSIVIAARSARDHRVNASKSVDLSDADFEVKDTDGMGNPAVKALTMYSSSTSLRNLNLISGGPNAIFLFETEENVLDWPEFYTPGSSTGERFRQVPVSTVIDGVETLRNSAGTGPNPSLKRLHNHIDAGFSFISALSGYVNESIERKVSRIEDGRIILQDTNNSTVDFVVITGPAPRKYDHPQLFKQSK